MSSLKRRLRTGNHIFTWGTPGRANITHHGIYIGRGYVIHYQGGKGETIKPIVCTSLEDFMVSPDAGLGIIQHLAAYKSKVIVERAATRLGEDQYHFAFNNCEHFAFDCQTGRKISFQVFAGALFSLGLIGAVFFRAGAAFVQVPSLVNGYIFKEMNIKVLQNNESPAISFIPHFEPISVN